MFLRAARHGELDMMRGVSANVMCGQEGLFGTASFQVVLDMDEITKLEEQVIEGEDEDDDEVYVDDGDETCQLNNLTIENNVTNIKIQNRGGDNDYNPGF